MHTSPSKENIDRLLSDLTIPYSVYEHSPVFTCEEADGFTREPEYGLKSLVLKSKKHGIFCTVLEGNGRLDLEKIRTLLQDKRISFVTQEDAVRIIGCDLGSIPPFGHMQSMPIYISQIITEFPRVYFNPGINTCTYEVPISGFKKIIDSYKGISF